MSITISTVKTGHKYKIAEYMQTDVTSIHLSATFLEAIEIMIKKKRNGLVVVDRKNKVVGMLSTLHFIKHIVPDYLEDDKHLAAFEAGDIFVKRTKEVRNDPIKLFMNTEYHPVKAEDSLMEAATLMSEFNVRHLPVVDNQGILIGYITRTDIKKAIEKILTD